VITAVNGLVYKTGPPKHKKDGQRRFDRRSSRRYARNVTPNNNILI